MPLAIHRGFGGLMSIPFLQRLAKLPRPSTLTDPRQINELVVLRTAGLVAAWVLRPDAHTVSALFLTLTQAGQDTLSALNPSAGRVG